MARLFSIRPGMSLKGRKFKGLRGYSGKPFHPPLTDIPITAYIFAAVFDIISYFKGYNGSGEYAQVSDVAHAFFLAGTYTIIGGAIVSLGTAVTGFWDWWKGLDRDRSTGLLGKAKHTQVWRTANWHMTLMLTTTAIVIVDIIVRLVQFDDGYAKLFVMILSVLAAAIVSWGATYGGSLVYDYQFNVEDLSGTTVWDETEIDQMPGDKAHP